MWDAYGWQQPSSKLIMQGDALYEVGQRVTSDKKKPTILALAQSERIWHSCPQQGAKQLPSPLRSSKAGACCTWSHTAVQQC